MENLNLVLSLNRFKQKEINLGDVFQVAGRIEYCSATKLVLRGQEESQTFFVEESMQSSLNLKTFKKNQCVLLKIQIGDSRFFIKEIQLLVGSKKNPKNFNSKDFKKWHLFLRQVENFFLQEGLCPVQTPSLVSCPGTEPQIQFLSTHVEGNKTWLASSPELHLKKLLFRDATDIFEIHRCYRDNEKGDCNWNEFYMLEWYRSYASMDLIIQDTQGLFSFLEEKGLIVSKVKKFQKLFIPYLFKKHCGINLTPESYVQDLIPFLKKKDLWSSSSEESSSQKNSFEDLFHLIFLNYIEPALDPETPTFVYGYPPSLRAYSQLNSKGWADRFELYWKKTELANGFNEINSTKIQREVFEKDLEKHKDKDLKMDEIFLSEMEVGFPPTVGLALGLERLYTVGQNLEKFPLASVF